jgi:hypothetical protein
MQNRAVTALQFGKIRGRLNLQFIGPRFRTHRINFDRELVDDFAVPEYRIFNRVCI